MPRRVEFGKRIYEVRPPVVREAITLLSVAKEALSGDDDAFALVLHVLHGWYPASLYTESRAASHQEVTAYALKLMHEGTPASKRKAGDVAGDASSIDWTEIISMYMHIYGTSLDNVLNEPWLGFLLMATQMNRIEARESLNYLNTKSLPYIKSRSERNKAMAKLQRLAGIVRKPKKLTPQEAKLNLNDLAKGFASFGGLA